MQDLVGEYLIDEEGFVHEGVIVVENKAVLLLFDKISMAFFFQGCYPAVVVDGLPIHFSAQVISSQFQLSLAHLQLTALLLHHLHHLQQTLFLLPPSSALLLHTQLQSYLFVEVLQLLSLPSLQFNLHYQHSLLQLIHSIFTITLLLSHLQPTAFYTHQQRRKLLFFAWTEKTKLFQLICIELSARPFIEEQAQRAFVNYFHAFMPLNLNQKFKCHLFYCSSNSIFLKLLLVSYALSFHEDLLQGICNVCQYIWFCKFTGFSQIPTLPVLQEPFFLVQKVDALLCYEDSDVIDGQVGVELADEGIVGRDFHIIFGEIPH